MVFINKVFSKSNTKIHFFYFLLLILFVVYVFRYLSNNLIYLLDCDMSSELILSNLLHHEKNFLTTNWFYSTEIRVLNTQLVFAPLFCIFSNWQTIRLIGTFILIIILLISFFYFCYQLRINHWAILSLFLVGCISKPYFSFVISGTYYIPHLAITFLTIGLIAHIINKRPKISIVKIFFLFTLAFLAGLGGLRQLLILYIPLVLSSFIYFLLNQYQDLKNLKLNLHSISFYLLKLSSCTFIFSILGYIVNSKVLQKYYHFACYENIEFTDFSFSRLETILNGWLRNLGYCTGKIFSKDILILNIVFALLLILTIISLINILKNKYIYSEIHLFFSLFYVTAILLITLLFLFTNNIYYDRYLIPIAILYIPIIGLFLNNITIPLYRFIVIIFLIFSILFCTRYNMKTAVDASKCFVEEMISIKNILLEHKSYEGYSTFWNSNILTELSNGEISVWDYGDTNDGLCIDNLYEWLQLKSHQEKHPEKNIFVVLTSECNKNTHFSNLSTDNIIYKSDTRIVYLFKTYEELLYKLNPA